MEEKMVLNRILETKCGVQMRNERIKGTKQFRAGEGMNRDYPVEVWAWGRMGEFRKAGIEMKSNMYRTIDVEGVPKVLIRASFSEFAAEVERSSNMLDWPEGYDGNGAIRHDSMAWYHAVLIAYRCLEIAVDEHDFWLRIPNIHPGPEGGVDIYWRDEGDFDLLINVPAAPDQLVTYGGENKAGAEVHGAFSRDSIRCHFISELI